MDGSIGTLPKSRRRNWREALLPFLVPALGLALCLGILFSLPFEQLTVFVVDDTYYYLKVA